MSPNLQKFSVRAADDRRLTPQFFARWSHSHGFNRLGVCLGVQIPIADSIFFLNQYIG
ncbi:hypothetical protein BO443_150089 [Burkholderia orbicola]